MNAETLRRAAAQIRNDHGGCISRHTLDGRRWIPVADWLDDEADWIDAGSTADGPALAVARAYLGKDDDPEAQP